MSQDALVLQNDVDKVLAKVRDFKDANLAKIREESLAESRKLFTSYFVKLAQKFFMLSSAQLKEMSKMELAILAEAIAQKAKPWMILQKIFSWLLIIPGLNVLTQNKDGNVYYSWYYLHHRDILRKADKDYFPLENLLQNKYQAGYGSYY